MMEVEMNLGENEQSKQSFEMDVEAVTESNVSEDSESNNRLDEIISDYRRVQEAATNEIDRKRRSVRSKCEERLWMAALWRDYQLEIVKKTFEAEIKQIEREHQLEFNNLKESLMHELQDERKRLEALEKAPNANISVDKTGNLVSPSGASFLASSTATTEFSAEGGAENPLTADEQAAAATGRRLRRREDKEPNGNGTANAVTSASTNQTGSAATARRKQVNNIYTYNTLLGEQDILDDLGAIAKEAGSLGTSRRAAAIIKNSSAPTTSTTTATPTTTTNNPPLNTAQVNVSFDKGCLNYNWDIISVSDRIRVQFPPSSTINTVSVVSCNATELTVSSARSPATKISLSDLKSGKVIILTDDHLLQDS